MLSKLRSAREQTCFSALTCLLIFLCFQVLALCHIALGQQLNLHWLHKVICQMWDLVTVFVLVGWWVGVENWEAERDG